MPLSTISIEFNGAYLLLIGIIPVVLIYIYWGYSKTVPRLTSTLRILLTLLRCLVSVLIIILLFNPKILLNREAEKLPQLAILIDKSASMSIKEGNQSRATIISSIFNKKNLQELGRAFEVSYFTFSDSLEHRGTFEPESLKYDGTVSNLSLALETVFRMLPSGNGAILMITDGAYNSGTDPSRIALRSPTPIFTVGIGDTLPQLDLAISRIKNSPLVYLKDEVSVDVTLQGNPGITSSLELRNHRGELITRKNINFGKNEKFKYIQFNFKPDSAGKQTYSIEIKPVTGESIQDNNLKHFVVNVLESRIDALIIAGEPSADFSFLKRILMRDEDIELVTLVEKQGGEFYQSDGLPSPQNFDVIIMLDYPSNNSNRNYLNRVLDAVMQGVSVIIFPRYHTHPSLLRRIEHIIPGDFTRKGTVTNHRLLPAREISPLTSFFSEDFSFEGLPPVSCMRGWIRFKPEAVIVANFDNGDPAIGYTTGTNHKNILIAAFSLWKWSLQDREHSKGDSLISNFWINSMRWLSTSGDEDLFTIKLGKRVFSRGEVVNFSARLFNQQYKPLENASVMVEIETPKGKLSLGLNPQDAGLYSGSTAFYNTGKFNYQGIAIAGKDTLKTEGAFTVEAYNPEFNNPEMRAGLLRKISQLSGGKFYSPDEFSDFIRENSMNPNITLEKKEIKPFPSMTMLIIILFMLFLEWIIRKRKGLL